MDLIEFDLDMPYIADEVKIKSIMEKRKCSCSDATHFDYESTFKDKRRIFRLETRCITSMFERIFGKIKTNDCWKILIECVEDLSSESIKNISGVYHFQVRIEYDRFNFSDSSTKKQMILDLLMQGIKAIAIEKDWSFEPFETVCLKMKELGLVNEWIWKKSVRSFDKKYSAEVLCYHGLKSMDIWIVLKSKNGNEVKRKKIISELPDEFAYAKHLGELKWISENEVVLINKNGDKKWLVKI